jgi:hypothetical protein
VVLPADRLVRVVEELREAMHVNQLVQNTPDETVSRARPYRRRSRRWRQRVGSWRHDVRWLPHKPAVDTQLGALPGALHRGGGEAVCLCLPLLREYTLQLLVLCGAALQAEIAVTT